MKTKWFRGLACLIAAVLLIAAVYAAEAEGEFPELNEDGFLDSGEFVYENPEDGIWRYASDTLKIEIFRREQKKPARVWYEAEIWCAEGSEMPHMVPNNPEKWFANKNADYPYKICRKTGTVLAVNSDYCQTRMQQKIKVGIIIRNGVIYSDKTLPAKASKFPNLDCMALFPDGDMQVYYSNEKTAQEYLDDGARDVLAFGPWMIRDGEMNTKALEKYGKSKAPRTAVGMVEKGHYFFMMLEGRIKRSQGDSVQFLAEKLQEKGCQTAFNLDGGDTCTIVFMGRQLCKMTDDGNGKRSGRRTSDILGVGTSDLLPSLDDPF